jgi:hypothetical protein
MHNDTEITTLLSQIRAKRDLSDFVVAPSSKGKKKEVQKEVPHPVIETTNVENTPVMSTPSVFEVVETPKPKLTTLKHRDNKVHHSHFLARVQQAENTFSFEQKRRFYIDDKLYHTLSLLKFSSNIPNVSTFINILISQVLEENHKDIEAVLRDLNKI